MLIFFDLLLLNRLCFLFLQLLFFLFDLFFKLELLNICLAFVFGCIRGQTDVSFELLARLVVLAYGVRETNQVTGYELGHFLTFLDGFALFFCLAPHILSFKLIFFSQVAVKRL